MDNLSTAAIVETTKPISIYDPRSHVKFFNQNIPAQMGESVAESVREAIFNAATKTPFSGP